jgi:phage terminase small subunit
VSELTLAHRLFCEGLLAGVPPVEAYLAAGYRCKDKLSASAAASRLRNKPHIRTYLAEREAALQRQTSITRAELIDRLDKIAVAAEKQGQFGNAVRALEVVGRLSGFGAHEQSGRGAPSLAQALAGIQVNVNIGRDDHNHVLTCVNSLPEVDSDGV